MSANVLFQISLSLCIIGYTKGQTDIPFCPGYRPGPALNVTQIAGIWKTVYTQPSSVDCFTLQLNLTTVLDRNLHMIKYGDFKGAVDWSQCLVEVRSYPGLKHFIQGDGSDSGLLENIIITINLAGKFKLSRTADQWTVFGSPGKEVLLMRQCFGSVSAAFARPEAAWPTAVDLNTLLHENGIVLSKVSGMLCQQGSPQNPYNFTARLF